MRVFNSTAFTGRGYFLAFLYACFMLFIGFSAARQGLSHYYAEIALRTGSETAAASAINCLPGNPDAHKTQGLIRLRNWDYSAAADAFEQAIALRENDFLLWLRLGYTRLQLRDFNAAQAAYQKALTLAPNYTQPNFGMGSVLLETGQRERAFWFLSRAAESDTGLYPKILDLARTTYPDDPLSIERAVQAGSVEAKKIVARYLIEQFFMTPDLKSFLTGDELSEKEKDEFVRSLIEKQSFRMAREVWSAKARAKNIDVNTPIFDGGFENITESDESGFGWWIDQRISAISVARDDKIFHSGSSALRIKFAGNVEMSRPIISQLAYVEPHRKYQLKFFFRSSELISAGLPLIIISDGVSNEVLGRSNMQATDDKWVESKIAFIAKEAPVALISLQRTNCDTSPCPIFGELSLDDFSLAEN